MSKLSFISGTRMGAVALLALLPGWQVLQAQWYPPPPAAATRNYNYGRPNNSPADRAVEDLRQVAQRNAFSHGDRNRLEHAMDHLNQFSSKLYSGRFDRAKLNYGIDDLRDVLRRNRIDPEGRKMLEYDLNELMWYRSSYAGYRY